jgi:hypothetical protein
MRSSASSSASGREEHQLQLIGRQRPVPVQVERDLPVALRQMPRQARTAAPHSRGAASPQHQNSNLPLLVGVREPGPSRRPARPDAFIRERGDDAGSAAQTPSKPPPETTPSRLRAGSTSSSARRPTASRRCSSPSGTSRAARRVKLGSLTQSSRDQRRSRSHYSEGAPFDSRSRPRFASAASIGTHIPCSAAQSARLRVGGAIRQ